MVYLRSFSITLNNNDHIDQKYTIIELGCNEKEETKAFGQHGFIFAYWLQHIPRINQVTYMLLRK